MSFSVIIFHHYELNYNYLSYIKKKKNKLIKYKIIITKLIFFKFF